MKNNSKIYPNKKKTINKVVKAKIHKDKKPIVKAKPIVRTCKENKRWTEEKIAHVASKNYKGLFVAKKAPNKGMADATDEYLAECCWESFLAGNNNAMEALKAVMPNSEHVDKDSIQPSEVDADAFLCEKAKIRSIHRAIDHLNAQWQVIEGRKAHAAEEADKASKKAIAAKGLATKAKKAYILADKAVKQEKYAIMIERSRHARVMIAKAEKRQKMLTAWTVAEDDYIDSYIAEEERLNQLLAKHEQKLEIAKLAKRHENRQKALEEAFCQRYERAEYIPEKEEAYRYKIYSVPTRALFGHELELVDQMNRLRTEQPSGYVEQGKSLFAQFVSTVYEQKGPYVVNALNCVINNVAASQMSDIMGVEYGLKTPCKEMMSVTYDIMGTFNIYWKFIDTNYERAESKLREIRKFILKRLIHDGIEFHKQDECMSYKLLASNPSQQKKGQGVMGELETMKRTAIYREFGKTLEEAVIERTDNSAEWLKRNATMLTPSRIIRIPDGMDENGEKKFKTVPMSKILMVDDVEIERMFEKVTTIDGSKLTKGQKKALKLTMFDGQAVWLKDGRPTTQGRGAAMKFMAVAKPDYKLPEFAKDIMGNIVRVADYEILMTKSCWKAAKMGLNWYEFRDLCEELAKTCEGYNLLRAVRYSDREIGDEENPRNLARQLTQQIVKMGSDEPEKLTRNTRRWLKKNKKFWNILAELGELDKPAELRSPIARLFNRYPELIMHPHIQQYLGNRWTKKMNKACSGRLRTKGMYPYICQDPIAQIQICLEGRDPNATDLGVVKEGCVNLPKVKEGRKCCCVRYPANYLVAMIVFQQNCPEFNNLGNIAVLSYYGDTIVRADGDFDGDEMLFIFEQVIIDMIERTIETFKPSLIDFPHGKVPCDTPFGTMDKWEDEIVDALVRAQEYNLVGRYSNLAVICLQRASVATDPVIVDRWLNAAKVAHVGAIVCLDLVKGAAVPEELKAMLNQLRDKADDRENFGKNKWKMPWNQIFSHEELTLADVAPRSNSSQDRIAGCIVDDVGKFAVEFKDDEKGFEMKPIECTGESIDKLLPKGIEIGNIPNFVVDEEDMWKISGCHFDENSADDKTWKDIINGNEIGFKSWLELGWHNIAAILWKMTGVDMASKRNEAYGYIRNVVMKHVLNSEWKKGDRVMTLTEKYASIVQRIVKLTFNYRMPQGTNGIDPAKQGSFAMFTLNVFAKDILAVADGINDDIVRDMCTVKEVDDNFEFDVTNYSAEEVSDIVDDGTIWIHGDDYEDCYVDDYVDDFDALIA